MVCPARVATRIMESARNRPARLADTVAALPGDEGMRDASRARLAAGLDPAEQPRAATPIAIEDARCAAGPLLDERPTAVLCDDDLIAAGLADPPRKS